jgi:phosphoglycolate phosphatase-like HAD superfamily hydrolase
MNRIFPFYDSNKQPNVYNRVYNYVNTYLENLPQINNGTVIFDIDDTLINTSKLIRKTPEIMLFEQIEPIVRLCKRCKQLGYKVIILTARYKHALQSSLANLQLFDIPFDEIYHNDDEQDASFKIQFKQNLSRTNNIILCIGDQFCDIQGIDNSLGIKLPCREDKSAHFTFNNVNFYEI